MFKKNDVLARPLRRKALWLPVCGLSLLAGISRPAQADVFSDVPEASGYTLVYTLPIPTGVNLNNTAVPYAVDNSSTTPATFDRVAYYLELSGSVNPNSPNGYVYVSFDKLGGMTAANKIGVPNVASGELYKELLSNMNVASNVPGVITGTGIQTGNIEFWPSNFSQANDGAVPNASSGTFDFGDGAASAGAGYGSMQIHNYDLDGAGAGTLGQTLFGYNAWGIGSAGDLGIGNTLTGSPDWTFANNASNYTVRNLQILVRSTDTSQTGPSFVVNTTSDTDDSTCSAGDCSLREAINAANGNLDASTISFDATAFAGTATITLNGTQLPTIATPVTINGPVGGVVIDGNFSSRVFMVSGTTASFNLISIINGQTSSDVGTGLFNDGGMVTIDRCTISGNASVAGNAGGILNNSVAGGTATVTVTNSTLNNNSAGALGGAVFNFAANNSTANMSLTNCTLYGNASGSQAGGAENFTLDSSTANLTITNCTFSTNYSASGDSIHNGQASNGPATTTIGNTILNSTTNNLANNSGTITSAGYNIAHDNQSAFLNQSSDRNSTDPLLDVNNLQDNGGPTQTIALQGGSPAIDKGKAFDSVTTDQRGNTRPIDIASIPNAAGGDGSDIGAYEATGLSINNVTVTEGNSGSVLATFTVTLAQASAQTVTVDYLTAPAASYPASPGSDYVTESGKLTFAPGELTKTITVQVGGDTLYEGIERFVVNLIDATNAAIVDNEGFGTITDDDAKPTLAINDVSLLEGDSGTTNFDFTVTLSAPSGKTTTVQVATAASGSAPATAGSDYVAVPLTALTFAPGETTKTVTVQVSGDTTVEGDERFSVKLSSAANATIADNEGVGTILEDDLRLNIANVIVTEGNSGTVDAVFTVTLSAAGSRPVTVKYATGNLSSVPATAGVDYVAVPLTTLTFAAGQTSKTVTVKVNGDTLNEANELFAVNLSAPVGARISDGEGVATITDDDAAPTLSINDVTLAEGDSGTTAFNFTVSLSAASGKTVTLKYATATPTTTPATAGVDYTTIALTTLTFAPGETSKTVTVLVNGDTTVEGNEKFSVKLSNPSNATITRSEGFGTITNDDAATLLAPFEDEAPSE